MDDRRRSRRIELGSKIIIKHLDQPLVADHETDVEVIDVSKNGLGFICSDVLQIGSVYEAYLTIWTKEVIHAFIEIVRIVKKEDGLYEYGGIFIGMPEMDTARIAIYETVSIELNKQG